MSTSNLQKQVSNFLHRVCKKYEIYENHRPEWLISDRGTRLELDFYIPEIGLAVEVQGAQHYIYVEHFHKSPRRFEQSLKDDEYKKDYCRRHNIRLVEISSVSDMQDIMNIVFPSDVPRGTKYQTPIRKQHKHFDKHLKRFRHISPRKDTFLETPSNKQTKFCDMVNRLHSWMDGNINSCDVHKKFFQQGLHKFLEGYHKFSREQDRDPKFLRFLLEKFPEYKADLYIARDFFREQDKLSHQTP